MSTPTTTGTFVQSLPTTGPFLDVRAQMLWPLSIPANENSFPPTSAGVSAHVIVSAESALSWYGPLFGFILAVALRGLLPRACVRALRFVHPKRAHALHGLAEPEDEHAHVATVRTSTLVARVHERISSVLDDPPGGLSKALEMTKSLPVLFLVLQPTYLTSYLCETPAVLAGVNGFAPWGHTPTGAEARLNYAHIARQGHSDKAVMAIWLMSWVQPSTPTYIALIAAELMSVVFHLVNMGELAQPHFRVKGLVASALLGAAWAL